MLKRSQILIIFLLIGLHQFVFAQETLVKVWSVDSLPYTFSQKKFFES